MKVGDRVTDGAGSYGTVIRVEHKPDVGNNTTEEIYIRWDN
jgi:preprotein translocase subunit YajC